MSLVGKALPQSGRVLVTGGTGFIGSALCRSLLAHGWEIYAVTRRPSAVPRGVKAVEGDLASPGFSAGLPKRVDCVIHAAQARPLADALELLRVNAWSTYELMEFALRSEARRFLLFSTGDVYGEGLQLFSEADIPRPQSLYGISKYTAELLARSFRDRISLTIIRPFNVYGPGQKGRMIPSLIEKIRSGESVVSHNREHPKRNPIYLDDFVAVALRLLEGPTIPVINVGGAESLSVRRMAEIIGEILGTPPRIREISDSNRGDTVGDISLLVRELGLSPVTGFREGVSRVVRALYPLPVTGPRGEGDQVHPGKQ